MKILPTLRQLRYLLALAEHRHFGRAAESCLATQSTLSAGLQELEAILGATLVERTKRKVMLTPIGEDVAERARRLLRDAEALCDVAAAAASPLTGMVRLGVIPTIAPYVLPRIMPQLRADFPHLQLYLREDLSARLLDRLAAGTLDVALLALPYDAPDMETLSLGHDPFVLACPADHPLAARDSIATEDLLHQPLLLLEEGHCLRDHALAACHLHGATSGEHRLGTSLATLVQMVANGLGITLLPAMAVNSHILAGTDLVTRPLRDEGSRGIGLMWRPSSPRKAEYRLLGQYVSRVLSSLPSGRTLP